MSINENYIDEIWKIIKDKNELDKFTESCRNPLKKSIKINLNKISVERFKEITKNWKWEITDPWFIKTNKIPNDSYYIDREDIEFALGKSFLHMSWLFYIQEIAAWMPARFLDIKEWDLILDISAAPWWKSSQIWDYLLYKEWNPWFVIANDVNWKRIQTLAHNLNRMWIYNSGVSKLNWFVFWKNLWEIFDHILVDAPCSWEWIWFKSDFSLKTWKKQEINKISWTQFQLLVSAIKSCKEWWTIVYSTCTMNPYENEENVAKILDFFKWAIELENVEINWKSYWISSIEEDGEEKTILDKEEAKKIARFRPHIQNTWGFFIAKFKKVKSLKDKYKVIENKIAPKNPFKIDISKWIQKQISKFLEDNYWIKINKSKHMFFATNKKVYLTSSKFMEIKDHINFEKVGVPILKFGWTSKLVPLHWLGNILWDIASKNFIELDDKEMQDYAELQDLYIDEERINKNNIKDREYLIIKYLGMWMWVGKLIDWRIKNKYIKI